jgi:signal transduction histidine kinase
MTKLLDKPFKAFTIYALIILLISIPIYFLVVDWIWVSEIDDHNLLTKNRVEDKLSKVQISDEELQLLLNTWNVLEPGSSIKELAKSRSKEDSTYEVTKFDEYQNETDRFRGLKGVIYIKGEPYLYAIEANVEESYETMFAIGLVTAVLYGLLVVGFITLNKSIAKQIWLPFDHTLSQLKSFDLKSSEGIHFEPCEIEEFEELNETVEKLILQNISIYKQQKSFIANASHELQTPIALLKSKLDLLFQNENLNEAQSELIQSIQIPLGRLTRVNKNLLLLAKIESSHFEDREQLDFAKILKNSLHFLGDYIEEKNLEFKQEIQSDQAVTSSRFLMETLVNNLLSNMIRHTASGGKIHVKLLEGRLIFSNSGLGALQKEFLFKRFAISTTETTSSGLGLAIVKEICLVNGWEIHYNFENFHHIFSIEL